MKIKIIGLTGPIASGKNSVAKILSGHGAFVIDVDIIGHQVLAPGTKVWSNIVKTFGANIVGSHGRINRKMLGKKVFSEPALLKRLNRIMHPEMVRQLKRKIRQISSTKRIIVINAAILAKMDLLPLVDKVIVVLANRKKRLNRLLKSGHNRADALRRIRSMDSVSKYRNIADIVIVNNDSFSALKLKVKKVLAVL